MQMNGACNSSPTPRTPCARAGILRAVFLVAAVACSSARGAETEGKAQFQKKVEPVLERYCLGCHGGGSSKGGVAFDQARSALLDNRELWWKTLKMLRAGMMPPKGKARPTAAQIEAIAEWIKRSALQIDPKDPDPGRVTVRRLNRIEYQNTVRDLMGVSYDTAALFPADDTGHGFDNIGDVLTLSPLLLEKYIAAARSIVGQAVPAVGWVVAEKRIAGARFTGPDGSTAPKSNDGAFPLSYYKPATIAHTFKAEHAGRYQLVVDLTASERFVDGVFDYNKCRLLFKADGKVLHDQEHSRQGGQRYHYEIDQDWKAGKHELTFEVRPLTPKEKQVRSLTLRIVAVTVRGPQAKEHWVRPPNYERFFGKGPPEGRAERLGAARALLRSFATRAYRRPVDDQTVDRLARLAERVFSQPGQTFEAGICQAMTVVLASPRFLFREEGVVLGASSHPLVDEHALASRLSYFLWSSMPDDELFRLAGENKLRENLRPQVERMLADGRSGELVRHFVGQWLQARGVAGIPINARAVIARDNVQDPKAMQQRLRFRELVLKPAESLTEAEKKELAAARAAFFRGRRRFAQFELNGELRRAMRQETEMLFEHILRNDRSLLEVIDCDYTFLNERLARHYGIEGVSGDRMRLVQLPKDSPRGGVLTQGTVLTVTSNPDRTSPVKRGLFILDNILGTPPPPPPPDVPALEEAGMKGRPATLREALKAHRVQPLCSSCHNRMDPLGLALENFNALGRWRDKERGQAIDASGELITGETFRNVRELKRLLTTARRVDYYRCVTEKMLTYALGRGLEHADVQTVDEIVAALEKSNGRPSVLLRGVIESVPFQKRRAGKRTEKE
jgi:mono/diheme cytochrome c family protein